MLFLVFVSVHWKATWRILGNFYYKIKSKNLEIMYPPHDLILRWDNSNTLAWI